MTVTVVVTGPLPSSVTNTGITLHDASVGAPLHLKFTCPVNPAPPTLIEYIALFPAATVEVDAPVVVRVKSFPEPAKATVCTPPVALSFTTKLAEREPAPVGKNATVIGQVVNAATKFPQPFDEIEKSAAFVPVIDTLDTCRTAVPALVKFAVCKSVAAAATG
jgi:hypothetical protein